MDIRQNVSAYLKDTGRTYSWLAQKVQLLGAPSNFDEKKISAALNKKRKLDSDEFLYICKALGVSPDIFSSDDMAS